MRSALKQCRARASFAGCFRELSASSTILSEGTASFGYEDVPVEEKKSRVAGVFGNVASSYDVMNDLMSGGLHRLWKDRLVSNVKPFPGMRHLDVAGGTGDVALRIQRAVQVSCRDAAKHPHDPILKETGTVTVCDINAAMLQEGKQKHSDAGLQWVLGDAESLPFADNTMDAYTIAFGLRNVTDIPKAISEAFRVLRPGGKYLCLEFSTVTVPGLQQIYDAYSFNVIPQLGRLVANDEASYRYLVESIRRFPKQEALLQLVQAAGFKDARYKNLTGGVVAIHSGFKL